LGLLKIRIFFQKGLDTLFEKLPVGQISDNSEAPQLSDSLSTCRPGVRRDDDGA
jgi:hypothetical protein